ncbi:hypothetical protein KEM48_004216 [Puccinia striiformis f. sp. tritici PST-130]|uniref:Trafficking protein particle complex subunit n=1 Tax=Puccinia striiformis f. sp. tritici PST-78 TaxID=1165861 RepID=A0A0L0UWB0_9BASI|nr:hypothetical protein KEM48_004216 [Puccinia striiformis f. sp. tritici PST-130]KNE91338.1 hypothetical protein PSTG_15267 [Puccinia striiformis f. sp. tritici PST-78]
MLAEGPSEPNPGEFWARASRVARLMTIYSFYVFDRHCVAVYYQDWHRSPLKAARPDPHVLPCVSPAISPMKEPNQAVTNPDQTRQQSAMGNLPFNNRTGVVIGGEEVPSELQSLVSSSILKNSNSSALNTNNQGSKQVLDNSNDDQAQPTKNPGLPFDEEAKLVYGVVFSLRNMVQKLAGKQEVLHCYTTSAYTLHILTTPTNHTFVLFTSPMTESMRPILKTVWRTAWLDFVVRNPLVSIDSKRSGRGIDNDMFRRSVDNQMRSLSVFN